MEILPWVLTSGWASGVNAYLVVLILGLVERFEPLAQVPDVLARTDVLVIAGVLFLLETFADKIPYLDSLWDSVHTVVRPAVAAAIGALIAGDSSTMTQALMATTGGVTALTSHAVKAGLRAAVNTSPEPVSNVAVSVGEDVTVGGVMSLVFVAPWVAAGIALVFLLIGIVAVATLMSRILAWRRERRRRRDALMS